MSDRTHRRSLLARLRNRTPAYLMQYAALRLADRTDARDLEYPLLPDDFADSRDVRPVQNRSAPTGGAPKIGWLAIPPSAGSGGHTTQFRMMEAATAAGFANTLLLYDRHNGDFDHNAAVIRRAWPWLRADIAPVGGEISGFDAVVASSWPTAHVLATRAREGRRLYFIQDYEPYFSPRGSEYAFAEDTYRFGFRNICLGNMVYRILGSELGVESDMVPFGCDTETYHLEGPGARAGVVFYAKRGNDRRGYRLAVRALEHFHRDNPDAPIHAYGETVRPEGFPVINHGTIAPSSINTLYNSVVAGLALSFTNISLVAEEMLAAGVIPVINDSPLARADLTNPHARWAAPTPRALADALTDAVTRAGIAGQAGAAAASVTGRSWDPTGAAVAAIISDELSRGQ